MGWRQHKEPHNMWISESRNSFVVKFANTPDIQEIWHKKDGRQCIMTKVGSKKLKLSYTLVVSAGQDA